MTLESCLVIYLYYISLFQDSLIGFNQLFDHSWIL